MHIKTFAALRPSSEHVAEVSCPPYDVVDTPQAQKLARGKSRSFLHVIRSEIGLPLGTDIRSDAVYAKAAENLKLFQTDGTLVREGEPCLYIYSQQDSSHSQTGIVACCHVQEYEDGVIKRHEKTLADKEADRARHIKELGANTGPVFAFYRDDATLNALVDAAKTGEPLLDVTADGVRHAVWKVPSADDFVAAFQSVHCGYIADGHHRGAGAALAARERAAANPDHTGDEEYNWFLVTLFPASQLRILSYNRVVHDLKGMTPAEFIEEVGLRFHIRETTHHAPEKPGTLTMYIDGKWYELTWRRTGFRDPVDRLDLSILQKCLLAPVLAIHDPRTSKRIDFIGGKHGFAEVVSQVDSGESAVGFALHPVNINELMTVADADQIMPPKSTWFDPKLRSGLLVHTLD